jgi:hypothetical protein
VIDYGFSYRIGGGAAGEVFGFRCPLSRDLAMTEWLDRQPRGSWARKQDRSRV